MANRPELWDTRCCKRNRTSRPRYLAAEAEADVRHEYAAGRVVAMAGASEAHNLIKDNVRTELHARLRSRGCRVTTSDQRVKAGASYRYPDVVLHCGAGTFSDDHPPMLLDPELLVEVVSGSTSEADRVDKLVEYTQIGSLRELDRRAGPGAPHAVRPRRGGVARSLRARPGSLDPERALRRGDPADVYALVELPEPPQPDAPGRTSEQSSDGA